MLITDYAGLAILMVAAFMAWCWWDTACRAKSAERKKREILARHEAATAEMRAEFNVIKQMMASGQPARDILAAKAQWDAKWNSYQVA